MPVTDRWITVEAEAALYVDRGREIILCDRLPRPLTLVMRVNPHNLSALKEQLSCQ